MTTKIKHNRFLVFTAILISLIILLGPATAAAEGNTEDGSSVTESSTTSSENASSGASGTSSTMGSRSPSGPRTTAGP